MAKRTFKVWALTSGGEFRKVIEPNDVRDWRKVIRSLGHHLPVQKIERATLTLSPPKKRARRK